MIPATRTRDRQDILTEGFCFVQGTIKDDDGFIRLLVTSLAVGPDALDLSVVGKGDKQSVVRLTTR